MSVRFFNPGEAYKKIREEVLPEIDRVLSEGQLVGPDRPDVLAFEKALAEFTGREFAVGLNSGTDALFLALKAVGVKRGDEVIVSSHTFVASVQVVVQLGATPILVDLGEDWKDFITSKTTACIPCHIAGEVLPWEPVEGIAMIDDSCQALGAVGFKGAIQCWSFYPAKILGAYGDAGGITTNNAEYARDIKDYGNHWKSDYSKWGINSRLDNIQAAILNVKIKYLPQALVGRKRIAMEYAKLVGLPIMLPSYSTGRVWQDYIIWLQSKDEREALYDFLKARGIETMKNEYPFPMPKMPESFTYESESLRLPCNENMTDEDAREVVAAIHDYFKK